MREIAVLKKLDHTHVVKLHEVIDSPNATYMMLVMEFMEMGPVLDTKSQTGFKRWELCCVINCCTTSLQIKIVLLKARSPRVGSLVVTITGRNKCGTVLKAAVFKTHSLILQKATDAQPCYSPLVLCWKLLSSRRTPWFCKRQQTHCLAIHQFAFLLPSCCLGVPKDIGAQRGDNLRIWSSTVFIHAINNIGAQRGDNLRIWSSTVFIHAINNIGAQRGDNLRIWSSTVFMHALNNTCGREQEQGMRVRWLSFTDFTLLSCPMS